MPRFVLLYHDCPPDYPRPSHWDLMLEAGDVLRTWALGQLPRDWQAVHRDTAKAFATCPPLAAGNTVAAEQLADHRRVYLDYEGPVSGGRGHVTRVEAGTFDTNNETPDRWEFKITRGNLRGQITLSRVRSDGTDWQLTYQPDSEIGRAN